jgi:hypothetical protein
MSQKYKSPQGSDGGGHALGRSSWTVAAGSHHDPSRHAMTRRMDAFLGSESLGVWLTRLSGLGMKGCWCDYPLGRVNRGILFVLLEHV